MPKTKAYHFCAMRQGDHPDVLTYTDGVITTSMDLSDWNNYKELKEKISSQMGDNDIVILSLTLLGEVEE